jgi:hypothetical protein
MGAWGADTFDNDTACDWVYDLEECDDLSFVKETLERFFESSDDYIDADIGSEALAACEVIARLRGNFGVHNSYTESVDQWVESHSKLKTDGLLPMAQRVIDRVLTDDSELAELWGDSDSHDEWLAAVENLRSRLK